MAKIKRATANKIEVKAKIFQWDFKTSVAKIKPKVENWKALTVEIAEELYIAREYLNGQIGQRKDPTAEDYIQFTWSDYCDAIGVSKRTASSWLSAFVPADRSDTGEAYLMSPEEKKELLAAEFDASEARVAQFMKTKKRPDGWTRADDTKVALREELKKMNEIKNLWQGKKKVKPTRDYFAELVEQSDDLKKYAFKNPEQNQIQLKVFDTIDTYLRSFTDIKDRLLAVQNLSVKLKEMTNYYTELDIQAAEAAAKEAERSGTK